MLNVTTYIKTLQHQTLKIYTKIVKHFESILNSMGKGDRRREITLHSTYWRKKRIRESRVVQEN
jgi:hypothetical protein